MSRSGWTVKVAALLTLLLPGIALGADLSDAQAEPGRPNVVLVVVDDLDIGPLRRYPESFPNLNGLAQSGVSFNNAFVTDPLCCPSRATILTGRYSHSHGIWRNVPPNGGWPLFEPQEEQALPVWVDAGQYATGYTGRYLNRWDGSQVPPGWDEWHGRVLLNSASPPSVQGFLSDGRNEEGRTHTQVFADEAVSFIQRHAGEPFFLFVAPYAPHEPAAHPSAYEGLFAGARAPRNPAFNEKDVSDKPAWVKRRAKLSKIEIAAIDEEYRDRLRSTKDVDDLMGRIVAALQETGELNETYVVFTSDNGYHMGQHRLKPGKWTPYGPDIRVPLLVSGPGVPQGETRSQLVSNNDLAPTIAEWTGSTPTATVDGRSLAPLLSPNPPSLWRTALLIEAAGDAWQNRPSFHAVRTQRYLYVRYANGAQELYDSSRDPYQTESRHNTASRKLLSNLRRRLDGLRQCSGTSCLKAEGP